MNAVLAEILETGCVATPDGSSVPLNYHISAAEGAALQRLIRAVKPRVTLEIGFAYGISTLFICEALAEVGGERHIVIDPVQKDGWKGIGLYTLERAGYGSLIEFHGESSHQALPKLEQAKQRVDLALIDGWHTFDYVLVDFFYVDRLLNVGGVVMFDDARSYPAIRKVARYVATHRRYVPIPNEGEPPQSFARRAFGAATSILRQPPIRSLARHLVRPDVLYPDRALGLPRDNFIAFRKTGDDLLGDGSGESRKWDQHVDF
jgi:predicted O-methyltransferase YrrM